MLTLSRPQRQVLATLAVMGLCVAPTVYVSLHAWRINQPAHVHALERELGGQLGLRVSLSGAHHPRPGVTALRGVVLSLDDAGRRAPETEGRLSTEIARAETLWLRHSGRQLAIEADGLRLRGPQGPRSMLESLTQVLQRLGTAPGRDGVSLLASTCEIDLGSAVAGFDLRDVAWTYRANDDASRLTASFRIVEESALAPRCELSLLRQRLADGLHTTLTLNSTDDAPLPARVLGSLFVTDDWLGANARLTGSLTLHQAGAADWDARFQGTLDDVDLARISARVAPRHRLRGLARIEVAEARWTDQPGRGPGWVEAQGTITSNAPGTIGHELLNALQSQLGFRLATGVDPANPDDQEFQALGLAFAFGPDGAIRIGGALEGPYQPDAVLIRGRSHAPLAFAPSQIATVPGLIRTLMPEEGYRPELMIPAQFESLMIQRYLPAPAVDLGVQRAALEKTHRLGHETVRGVEE